MGVWKQINEYLFLRKKDAGREDSINVRVMHGINRISIFLFLFAIVVIVVRLLKSC